MRLATSSSSQRGVGLIELLVALVIISIGVLAVARLQIQMIQFNQQALGRTQASFLAQDMLDRLRADRNNAQAGNYNRNLGDDAPSGATLPVRELNQWLTQVGALLPGGDGAVLVNGANVEIRVRWDDSRGRDAPLMFALATQL